MQELQEITATEFAGLDKKQLIVVDVRTPAEYAEKRAAMVTAFAPVGELDPASFAVRHGITLDTPIYTLCASGNRAGKAAQKFLEAGFTHVTKISGGLIAWQEAGLPITGAGATKTAATPPSLERQVRFAAGFLVFLCTLLAITVHWNFIYLTFGVACGQIYSGITNWCGMGLLLAKAPWNKNCSSGTCSIASKPKNSGASCQ